MKQHIDTKLGVAVILIIAITVGAFVWKWEKNQPNIEQPQVTYGMKKILPKEQDNKTANEDVPQSEEFPMVVMQPGMSLEDVIKEALYKKTPDWKNKNYTVEATVETNEKDHAIGKFTYDNNQVQYHNAAEGVWFAAKSDEGWTLVITSYTGYWGSCQDFKKYNFPSDMTPDCWDTEKNILIDTANPRRFYADGFTKNDKQELVQAYIEYGEKNLPEGFGCKGSKCDKHNLYSYVRLDKSAGNYLRGTFFGSGGANIGFYATKQSDKWIVVYSGQDNPSCNLTDPYNFPSEIVKCYN